MRFTRVIIAGTGSSVGKTTIATGLMGALRERGLKVQGFKVGPDYIDPTYHTKVTDRPSRNLDSWMMDHETLLEIFTHAARDADVSVIEGVMGLFDGLRASDGKASTAEMAKLLRCPVILVVDAWGMSRSSAATVLGYKSFDAKVNLAGVIINRVSGKTHASECEEAITSTTHLPVIGCLPSNSDVSMPERHLGLIPTPESKTLEAKLASVIGFVRESLDLDMVLRIARSAPPLRAPSQSRLHVGRIHPKVSIGVAFDAAFNFYYHDALQLLELCGAKIEFFSPLSDARLREGVCGLYIGGGFPEVWAKGLEENSSMRQMVRKVAEDGMPILGECGGLMYLTQSITDFQGRSYKMVGALQAKTLMDKKLCLNYTLAKVVRDNPFSHIGDIIRGHEFHYSRITEVPNDARFAYSMQLGMGIDGKRDGWIEYSLLAPYSHTHFASNPKLARNFVAQCEKYSKA